MILDTVDEKKKGVHTRYLILLIIFIVTAVNYADRATLSIAGTEVAKELNTTKQTVKDAVMLVQQRLRKKYNY